MANHPSAKKRARTNVRRAEINTSRISRMRTFVKKVELAIASGNAEDAKNALREVQPEILRNVGKGLLHKNTAARKLSRLSARIKAL
jgi:small subunit ribosomal protein S20